MAQGLYIAQKVGGPYAALAASAGSAPRSNVVLPEDVNKEFETAMQPEMTPEQQQELEAMMKEWQQEQEQMNQSQTLSTPVPPTQPSSAPVTSAKPAAKSTKNVQPVKAMLFVSPTCPRCQRLKRDGWAAKFQRQYQGQIRLVEYDLSKPENDALLHKMMRKYKLSTVNYPTLFIGDSVVQGYPLTGADEAAQKAIAKYGPKTTVKTQKQFMQITMDDTHSVKGKAPQKDRQAMQKAIEKVQQDNQKTTQDIGEMFGGDTQSAAFAITAKTEQILWRKANASASLNEYLAAQKQVLAQQEQSLNKLMQENARFIRDIR